MKLRLASALIAGLMISVSPQAMAQKAAASSGPIVPGIATADLAAVVGQSNAYRGAVTQRQTYFKPQLDQAQTRATAIQAQLKPLIDKFDADRKAATPNTTALETQYRQIQQIQQAGQEEINRIIAPVNLSEAYVEEQITDQIGKAVTQATTKKKISLLLRPDATIFRDKAYDVTADILAEINTLVPSAQLVPPAGWVPRAQRDQAAQQQGAAAAPAPQGKQPEGR
ncbi:MAG: hypothetical protein B7Z36_03630 [Novosphingobium sp. 12-63-9]|nr:MAG: hypothetical protein B7Z36_03630 [Novosphingobium sp. 12-63-9]